jgi:methyl-accepting chemotaxis protein
VFNSLPVAKRLIFGFTAVVAISLGIAACGSFALNKISRYANEMANERMVKVEQFTKLKDNLNAIARSARNIVISDDAKLRAAETTTIRDLRKINSEIVAALDKAITQPKGRELLAMATATQAAYDAAIDSAVEQVGWGDKGGAAMKLTGEGANLQNVIFKAVEDSRALQQQIAAGLAAQALATASFGSQLMIGLGLLVGVVGGLVGWITGHSIRRDLGTEPTDLRAIVGEVANGDLSKRILVADNDSASVLAAVARMQAALTGVVSAVRQNSESVATASSQIALGNQDLSGRTEEQASALQQTAATMEQLGTTVRHNADSAQQASQLAKSAAAVAARGGEVVNQVVTTMQGINDSSRKIGDIISLIDGIAFQTNILALNAAVEAARAGEQGRGFAVVAGEVRTLAQRSAEAAKEIKALIGRSVEQVEQGTALVDHAGQTMSEIVTSIRRVTDIVVEISSASQQQAHGVQQVGEAVAQMDQATQQSAALVQQSAAAAESLKAQAQQLVQAVAVFKL